MAIRFVSHVLQYLTLDMIAHLSRDQANSHVATGALIPAPQARFSNVVRQPGAPLASGNALGGADGDSWLIRIAAIAASLIQPSRGIGVHSKQSRAPWKPSSSRSLRPR